ncbi:hypothetical protein [Aurantiacibacter sp. MUD61]|uniref:hypothetical protein n=1 Tax=Aurantiacibacter sp. MUD61 TaxID=3009083 RepID=UPI0022F07BF8|nr:hypothetical protein [Aurantiacibacter sp. MUD61]
MKTKVAVLSVCILAMTGCANPQPTSDDPAEPPALPADSQAESVAPDANNEAAGSEDEARADAGALRDTIPERFHGRWAESLDHCETRGHQRYDIGAREIGFFESTGIVQNVRADGDYAAATVSEQYGDAPPSEYAFYMAIEDADTMRVRYDDRPRFRIYRCDAND